MNVRTIYQYIYEDVTTIYILLSYNYNVLIVFNVCSPMTIGKQ